MNPAKGQIDRLPDHRLLGIGHHHRALEMVGMDLVEGRADTGVVHDSHRPLVEPDVFADDTPRAVMFGDDVAGEIMDIMGRLIRTCYIALRQPREVIVEIFGAELAAQHHDVQLTGGVDAVILGEARGGITLTFKRIFIIAFNRKIDI